MLAGRPQCRDKGALITTAVSGIPTGTAGHGTRAVIFTHFDSLRFGKDRAAFDGQREELVRKHRDILKPYLKCNEGKHRIAIVYGYVDWAIKKGIPLLQIDNNQFQFLR